MTQKAIVFASALGVLSCDAGAEDREMLSVGAPGKADYPGCGQAESCPEDWGPACDADGCVRGFERVSHVQADELRSLVPASIRVDNGYSVLRFRYLTQGRENLALMTLPNSVAPPGGFHVVVNAHGTTGLDDPCALVATDSGLGLAATFGARGMIGIAPEYPGLGTEGTVPYLVADSEGAAMLDAIRAGLRVAQAERVPTSGRSAVVGLSQGGHAVLSAAAMHASYAPEQDVRAFGAVSPASVWEEQWREGIAFDGSHIAFHALLIYAWAQHYAWDELSLFSVPASQLDTVMREQCYSHPAGSGLPAALGEAASEIFDPDFLAAYRSGIWGPEYSAVQAAFSANRVVPFAPSSALRIWQGTDDAIIPEFHTTQLAQGLIDGGMKTLEYTVVPGGGHTSVAFSFLASPQLRTEESLAWLQTHLDRPAY